MSPQHHFVVRSIMVWGCLFFFPYYCEHNSWENERNEEKKYAHLVHLPLLLTATHIHTAMHIAKLNREIVLCNSSVSPLIYSAPHQKSQNIQILSALSLVRPNTDTRNAAAFFLRLALCSPLLACIIFSTPSPILQKCQKTCSIDITAKNSHHHGEICSLLPRCRPWPKA